MVDSLKIEVALDGSEKVKRDFYDIGVAGRQAFLGIAEAAAAVSAAFAVGLGVALVAATKKAYDFANAAERDRKALTQLQKVSGHPFKTYRHCNKCLPRVEHRQKNSRMSLAIYLRR